RAVLVQQPACPLTAETGRGHVIQPSLNRAGDVDVADELPVPGWLPPVGGAGGPPALRRQAHRAARTRRDRTHTALRQGPGHRHPCTPSPPSCGTNSKTSSTCAPTTATARCSAPATSD